MYAFPFLISQERFCVLSSFQCYLDKWGWLCLFWLFFIFSFFLPLARMSMDVIAILISLFRFIVFVQWFQEVTNVRCERHIEMKKQNRDASLCLICAMNNKDETQPNHFNFNERLKVKRKISKQNWCACVLVCVHLQVPSAYMCSVFFFCHQLLQCHQYTCSHFFIYIQCRKKMQIKFDQWWNSTKCA